MNIKRLTIIITILAIALMGTMAANAQEDAPQADRPVRDRAQQAVRTLINIIVEETGLTTEEIREALGAGATLNEVIEANGGSTQAIIDAAIARLSERVAAAIANGNLTEERGATILAEAEARISEALNRTFEQDGERAEQIRERIGQILNRSLVSRAAEALGMEHVELLRELRAGQSLATLLSENSVDVAAFKAGVLADAEARINEALEAGQITVEQGEELIERLSEAIDTRLDRELEGRRDRPRRPNAPDASTTDA